MKKRARARVPHDVLGAIEEDYTENRSEDIEQEEEHDTRKSRSRPARPLWTKSEKFRKPIPKNAPTSLSDSHPDLTRNKPFELFLMFYSEEMKHFLVTETNRSANQHNLQLPVIPEDEMTRFVGSFFSRVTLLFLISDFTGTQMRMFRPILSGKRCHEIGSYIDFKSLPTKIT